MGVSSRNRAFWIGATAAALFTGVSLRLVDLQVARHEYYSALALEKHSARQSISARRGSITDASGEMLATNEPVKTVVVDASITKRPDDLAEVLARHLEMPGDVVRQKIARNVW